MNPKIRILVVINEGLLEQIYSDGPVLIQVSTIDRDPKAEHLVYCYPDFDVELMSTEKIEQTVLEAKAEDDAQPEDE